MTSVSLAWQGLIAASALIGIFFGGPLGGWLSDRFGRSRMFTLDMFLFAAGSVAQFLVDNGWQLLLVRLLMGVAIGAEYSIDWPLLAEFPPTRLRGNLPAFQEVAWYLGRCPRRYDRPGHESLTATGARALCAWGAAPVAELLGSGMEQGDVGAPTHRQDRARYAVGDGKWATVASFRMSCAAVRPGRTASNRAR